jgi:hypothetical protein
MLQSTEDDDDDDYDDYDDDDDDDDDDDGISTILFQLEGHASALKDSR